MAFPARSVTPVFETIPRARPRLGSNHVSERFYVVHLIDGTYELFRHFYRVKGFASRGLFGLF
jgi:hypothetical protein